jgi:hypothetical protein
MKNDGGGWSRDRPGLDVQDNFLAIFYKLKKKIICYYRKN